ncbi:MAG: hypothetical protein AseanaTS_07630 [Candidatus Pelagadaptatus aseana]|uniref:GNAT family N-acetyltransferase n=1 Tax=Candidatus Pelagadaptatus aseana TaxID=3120508 RepID=UPI0039B1DE1A
METPIIRDTIKPGDIGRIISLHGELYDREHGYDHTFEAYVAEPLAQCIKRNNDREKIWIVERQQQTEGSIAICERDQHTAQLRWFILSPELRGLGLSKTLMKTALQFCIDNNYQTVELWTVKGLEAARKLYCQFGFELNEEHEHRIWGAERTEQKYVLCLRGDTAK